MRLDIFASALNELSSSVRALSFCETILNAAAAADDLAREAVAALHDFSFLLDAVLTEALVFERPLRFWKRSALSLDTSWL